ncbi:6-carboxytetrahydropterin synthase [Limosilactobacillus sp.]|uniref:6-carboxytetrahydropterin synthase n=1 Tax=Limosilactobacillus sp. TaxID=2773925 RepID=UPI003F0C9418
MKKSSYKLSFFLNASHIVQVDGSTTSRHPHTFSITCQITTTAFKKFGEMEDCVNQVLNQLNNSFLNEVPPFDQLNPTLENLTTYLFDQISAQLTKIGYHLSRLEVAESPVRAYCIEG